MIASLAGEARFDVAALSLRKPAGACLAIRVVNERAHGLHVLRGVVQPDSVVLDAGAMVRGRARARSLHRTCHQFCVRADPPRHKWLCRQC